jgi:hypothetical protein
MADTTEYTMVKQDFPNDWLTIGMSSKPVNYPPPKGGERRVLPSTPSLA